MSDFPSQRRAPYLCGHARNRPIRGLAHVAGREGTVEPGGGLGEFDGRHFEKPGRGADELGGDVASAAGAAHVVEGLFDGGHVEFLGGKEWCFHGLLGCGLVIRVGRSSHPGLR